MRLSIVLDAYPADTALDLVLPPEAADLSLGALLDRLCPADGTEPLSPLTDPGLRANPDLPACRAALDDLVARWRDGYCDLALSSGPGGCRPAHPDDRAGWHVSPARLLDDDEPRLELRVGEVYRPERWACARGYAADPDQVRDWLRSMTALYLVDRHGTPLPDPDTLASGDPDHPLLDGLRRRGALAWTESGPLVTTPGREVIAANIAETERLIDDFDRYSDVCWDEERQETRFATGAGADLRVPVYVEHGLDPLRSVFLLRLYDGSLDWCRDDWRVAVSPAALAALLEPLAYRVDPDPPPDILAAIIADGLDQGLD